MLAQITRNMLKRALSNTPRYYFGGGGHHHEIDYYAVVTKNMKSCTFLTIQNTISTPTKLHAELPEWSLTSMASKTWRRWTWTLSSGNWVILLEYRLEWFGLCRVDCTCRGVVQSRVPWRCSWEIQRHQRHGRVCGPLLLGYLNSIQKYLWININPIKFSKNLGERPFSFSFVFIGFDVWLRVIRLNYRIELIIRDDQRRHTQWSRWPGLRIITTINYWRSIRHRLGNGSCQFWLPVA